MKVMMLVRDLAAWVLDFFEGGMWVSPLIWFSLGYFISFMR
jgi:hypothetical protein